MFDFGGQPRLAFSTDVSPGWTAVNQYLYWNGNCKIFNPRRPRNGKIGSHKNEEKVRLTRADTLKKNRWRKSTIEHGQNDVEQSESSTVSNYDVINEIFKRFESRKWYHALDAWYLTPIGSPYGQEKTDFWLKFSWTWNFNLLVFSWTWCEGLFFTFLKCLKA